MVDNGAYGYSLEVSMGTSAPDSSQYVYVLGAKLTYEIDRLVP